MTDRAEVRVPGYLRPGATYWRSVAALLVFQAMGWALAAGLAYLILSPGLAKDYFSAHHTVRAVWQLVVPALAVSAGVGFLVVGIGSAASVWSHSRRLLAPLHEVDALVRGLGAGRMPAPPADPGRPGVGGEFAAALEPLREREQELRRLAREIQKVSLELNYRSTGTAEVTLKDLRALSARLEELSRGLSRTSGWFEA